MKPETVICLCCSGTGQVPTCAQMDCERGREVFCDNCREGVCLTHSRLIGRVRICSVCNRFLTMDRLPKERVNA